MSMFLYQKYVNVFFEILKERTAGFNIFTAKRQKLYVSTTDTVLYIIASLYHRWL